MNLQEAFQELGIPQGSTEKEIKKKYRELSAKYHPDICKEPDAEAKMKNINVAYDKINKGEEPQNNSFDPFSQQERTHIVQNIELHEIISFKEAVFGTKKDLKFKRKVICKDCNGQSQIKQNNGCKECKGTGTKTHRQQNMIFQSTCGSCFGRVNFKKCDSCINGTLDSEISININIPGGIKSGNILRLSQMGNFAGNIFNQIQYSDAFLHLVVTPREGFSLDDDGNVLSEIQISLLEAIVGCKKTVPTASGESDITIPPMSKNKETVILRNLGANNIKSQIVSLNVSYPENILSLLESK